MNELDSLTGFWLLTIIGGAGFVVGIVHIISYFLLVKWGMKYKGMMSLPMRIVLLGLLSVFLGFGISGLV